MTLTLKGKNNQDLINFTSLKYTKTTKDKYN
ncbi:uncharacterized protein METZ01_LOCUS300346 [marine metagenome]|uniref:Uncharacterized protein n=1 Tax=marine metagenome TaxID=408172 RepID=A0A382MJA1_9ZZZZ